MIGERIRAVREYQRLSQRELARLTDANDEPVSYGSIAQIERGERQRPSLPVLNAIAHALGWSDYHAMLTTDALEPPRERYDAVPSELEELIERAIERKLLELLRILMGDTDAGETGDPAEVERPHGGLRALPVRRQRTNDNSQRQGMAA